jgi:hypothetical protein
MDYGRAASYDFIKQGNHDIRKYSSGETIQDQIEILSGKETKPDQI